MSRSSIEVAQPLGSRLRKATELAANMLYDGRRYWRHSFTSGVRGKENLRARIAIGLHFLEYGLSLSGAQPGHGLDKARQLAIDLGTYIDHYGQDATVEIALKTLAEYLAFNTKGGAPLPDLQAQHEALSDGRDTGMRGGCEVVTADDIRARSQIDFLSFAEARHSIRQFASGPVDPIKIERAVRIAQQSPSSCNRQTCRAWIWTEPQALKRVIALQNGNRGFGDQLAGVALVTSDLAHWETAAERYQGWVDGGMFAMSLAYGFHAEGLGAVMLNWSVKRQRDRELRALTGIPESSLVITMLGFGNLPERLTVPVSQRKPLELALSLNAPLNDSRVVGC